MANKVEPPVSYTAAVIVLIFCTLIFVYFYCNRLVTLPSTNDASTSSTDIASSTAAEDDSRSLTAKQRKKQELKEAKRRQRVLIEEERREKEKLKQERQDEIEKRREEKEKQRQEEEAKRAEDARKEYMDIVSSFVVENEGQIQDHGQLNVDDFISFVVQKKMTSIAELAAKFDLQHKEVAERLNDLEVQGRLFGLLDERGRYLYISDSEMDALDNYINKSGRIHKYIGLTPFCNATFSMEPAK
ncbi:DDRGK domain [Babesia ovis]|uniref:DDRGK domain n=1 Tax=Babesia ovis TaxID=5869 RepID=A0A9W5WWA2_BABOV|nr:DDRGK domain [Babesia ovis]